MKYTGRKGLVKILTVLILTSILLQNNSIAFAESKGNAKSSIQEQIIIGEGDAAQTYEAIATKVQYNEQSYDCPIPMIQWNNVWMVPAKIIFSDILGCYYQFSEDSKSALITTPDKENSIKFTLNSKDVLVNDKSSTLPTEVVIAAKKDNNITEDNESSKDNDASKDTNDNKDADTGKDTNASENNDDAKNDNDSTGDNDSNKNDDNKDTSDNTDNNDSEKVKDSDYMVPLDFTMKSLGFTYSVSEQKVSDGTISCYLLKIQSNDLYYVTANDLSYDKKTYSNMLIGVVLQENSSANKNMIKGITLDPASQKNIKIISDAANYSVTMQFLNTYNPFGTVTKSIKNGITNSIKIWETEDKTTCVQVHYNQKKEYSSKITTKGGTITLSKGIFSMKVLLPEKVTYSSVTTSDQYWNQKFLINIPGNYVSFYKEHAPVDNSSYITKISVSLTSDKNTKITVTTKGLKGYKLTKGSGYFTVKVGNPKDIYQNIVVIDAGHGGKDSGAVRNGLTEKNLTLSIAYKYLNEYFEKKNSPVKAYWTRHDDTFINLYERPTYSAKYQADLFVSLHMNSAGASSANGTEVYYSSANNSKSFSGITSKLLAQKMKNTLVNTLSMKDRGVKQAGFVVIKYNTVPSILMELGFVTGNSDSKKLKTTSFQKKAAKTIYQGLCKTFESYPTGR